jgi:hypothetical protein
VVLPCDLFLWSVWPLSYEIHNSRPRRNVWLQSFCFSSVYAQGRCQRADRREIKPCVKSIARFGGRRVKLTSFVPTSTAWLSRRHNHSCHRQTDTTISTQQASPNRTHKTSFPAAAEVSPFNNSTAIIIIIPHTCVKPPTYIHILATLDASRHFEVSDSLTNKTPFAICSPNQM